MAIAVYDAVWGGGNKEWSNLLFRNFVDRCIDYSCTEYVNDELALYTGQSRCKQSIVMRLLGGGGKQKVWDCRPE
jgi:hypothetical protein